MKACRCPWIAALDGLESRSPTTHGGSSQTYGPLSTCLEASITEHLQEWDLPCRGSTLSTEAWIGQGESTTAAPEAWLDAAESWQWATVPGREWLPAEELLADATLSIVLRESGIDDCGDALAF